MNNKNEYTVIVSDSEGNKEHFFRSLALAHNAIREEGGGSSRLVFLGDAVDKGESSLAIVHALTNNPTAILIIGNRDANKGRLLELFSKNFITKFGTGDFNKRPFWSENFGLTPLAFLEVRQITVEEYDRLSFTEKQVIVLQWMLPHTMGAPKAFEYRRQELSNLMKINPNLLSTEAKEYLDILVARSFLEEITTPAQQERLKALPFPSIMNPKINIPVILRHYESAIAPYQGQLLTYLERGKILYVDDGNLYAHSLFNLDTYPILPSGKKLKRRAKQTEKQLFENWVRAVNAEFQDDLAQYYFVAFDNLARYSSTELVEADGIRNTGFIRASLRQTRAIESLRYVLMSINATQFSSIELVNTAQFLSRVGVSNYHYGHQPQAQYMPVCQSFCLSNVRIIGYDTAWSQSRKLQADGSDKIITHTSPMPVGAIISPKGNIILTDGKTYCADTSDPLIGKVVELKAELDGFKAGMYRIAAKTMDCSHYYLIQQTTGQVHALGSTVFKDGLEGRSFIIPCGKISLQSMCIRNKRDSSAILNDSALDVGAESDKKNRY